MNIKSIIQQDFILKAGKRKHQRKLQKKGFVSLKDAVSVGLTVDLRDHQSINPISDFYNKVKKDGGNYKILIFLDEKRENINQYDYEKLFPGARVILVSSGDYSILGVPRKNIIAPFISDEFDVLFRLELGPCFEMDMVILSTRATMYAGHDDPELSFLDFRITLAQSSSTESLCKNLLTYMGKLDHDQKETSNKDFTLF